MKTKILFSFFASFFVMGVALAEHHEDSASVYSAEDNTLKLTNVHYTTPDGETLDLKFNATFKLSNTTPLEFSVVGDVCEAPKTWHAEMNHCMVQNDDAMQMPDTGAESCMAPQVWNEAMGHCMTPG